MKAFRQIFKIELKLLAKPAPILAMAIIMVIALVVCKIGIDNYNSAQTEKEVFLEMSKKRIETIPSYKAYAKAGHHILFIPSNMNIYFCNSTIPCLVRANVNTGYFLAVNRSVRGKSLYSDKSTWDSGFSLVVFLLGGLISLSYGFFAFRNRDYIRMLSSIYGEGKLFLIIVFARLLLMGLYFAILFCSAVLLTLFNMGALEPGFALFSFILYLGCYLSMITMFSIGLIIGHQRLKGIAPVLIFAVSLLVGYGIPKSVEGYFKNKASKMRSIYEAELDAMRREAGFENRAEVEAGKWKDENRNTESEQKLIESYYNNEHKKIMEIDRQIIRSSKEHLLQYRQISALFPMAFYVSVAENASSVGYEHFQNMSEYVNLFARCFTRYWIDKQFYTLESKVKDFTRNSKNIFRSSPSFPPFFGLGIICSLLHSLIFSCIGFILFKRTLKIVSPKKEEVLNNIDPVKIISGDLAAWVTKGSALSRMLYGILRGSKMHSGKKDFDMLIELDGQDVVKYNIEKNFFYACSPKNLPLDLKVKDVLMTAGILAGLPADEISDQANVSGISWDKKLSVMESSERSGLILALLTMIKRDIYIVSEAIGNWSGMEKYDYVNKLLSVAQRGGAIFYWSRKLIFQNVKKFEFKDEAIEDESWKIHMESLKYEKAFKENRKKNDKNNSPE